MYGYNADVIGGLFQVNNRNSISQHGRDLDVRLKRDIEDEVILQSCYTSFCRGVGTI